MQDRSFFEVVVQIAAVLTAVPVVSVLACAIFEALSAYRFEELRMRLLTLVRDDILRTLEHEPANWPRDAPEKRRQALARIKKEQDDYDEVALERRHARSAEFMGRLLAEVDGPPIFAGLDERVRRQSVVCEQSFLSWLRRSVPLTIVNRYKLRLELELLRLAIHAILDIGWSMTSVLMRRAGLHVTNGAIAGVVLGILVWSGGTRYQGRFFDYIGVGGTLGGFVGLAATSWLVVRTVRDHYREGDERVAGLRWSLLALLACVETFQLLVYFGALDP